MSLYQMQLCIARYYQSLLKRTTARSAHKMAMHAARLFRRYSLLKNALNSLKSSNLFARWNEKKALKIKIKVAFEAFITWIGVYA